MAHEPSHTQCCALKKKSNIRCSYARIPGGDLCGVHKRSINIRRYNDVAEVSPPTPPPTPIKMLDLIQVPRMRFHTTRIKDIQYTLHQYGQTTCTGPKTELWHALLELYGSVFPYLGHVPLIVRMQNAFRTRLMKRVDLLQGPSRNTLSTCVNKEEVLSLENIDTIPAIHLFTYRESDGFLYAFDIRTIRILLEKKANNPYTRKPFPEEVLVRSHELIRLLEIMKVNTHQDTELDKSCITPHIKMRLRTTKAFQDMDELDQYTNIDWFLDLSSPQLVQFYKEAEDIWNYRLNLTDEVKKAIVPPNGKVFHMSPKFILTIKDRLRLQNICLDFIETLIHSAESRSDRVNGCIYVLLGLVIVNPRAAEALPAYYTMVTGDVAGANYMDVAV